MEDLQTVIRRIAEQELSSRAREIHLYQINLAWEFAGIVEAKRWFGLLSWRCPVCKQKTKFYKVIYQSRNQSERLPASRAVVPNIPLFPLMHPREMDDMKFGYCANGHKTSIIRVFSSDYEPSEYMISTYEDAPSPAA